MDWYNSLDPALRFYWTVALISSAIFIVQTVMTFLGSDSSDGLNADFDGNLHAEGPFQLFSIRNLINFFLGYGWAAVCFYDMISSVFWLNCVAIFIGLLFVVLFFFLILQILKLGKDNTFKISDTVGKNADVYLVIPAEKKGFGKIQVSVGGAVHEINAMTNGERIPTGGKIKVDSVIDNQTVLVSSI